MRSAYEPIPWLASPNPPKVRAVGGLGTGGGASFHSPIPGSGTGTMILTVGSNPDAAGAASLEFAAAPPTLFITASEGLGPIAVFGQGTTTVAFSWGVRPPPLTTQYIYYEWSVSQ